METSSKNTNFGPLECTQGFSLSKKSTFSASHSFSHASLGVILMWVYVCRLLTNSSNENHTSMEQLDLLLDTLVSSCGSCYSFQFSQPLIHITVY
jgi:hypothetical protein